MPFRRGDAPGRADRAAALAEAGLHRRMFRRDHHPADAAGDAVGHLPGLSRARREAAEQISAGQIGKPFQMVRQIACRRVRMRQDQRHEGPFDPFLIRIHRLLRAAAVQMKDAKRVFRQRGEQNRDPRFAEQFPAAGADPIPDGPDPVLHTGCLAQKHLDVRKVFLEMFGQIDEAETVFGADLTQLNENIAQRVLPVRTPAQAVQELGLSRIRIIRNICHKDKVGLIRAESRSISTHVRNSKPALEPSKQTVESVPR